MYSQSSNPLSNNGRSSPLPRDSSTTRLALDNLLRRELKVSDPNDSKQVAEALLARYKETPKAVAIDREAEGVPFLLAPSTPMPMMQAATSSDAEMQQAMNDVERDLKELTTNAILKDVTPELEGWGMAIRSSIQEGVNAARFALDPRQRDKTFGIRRSLGDYARMARLVGALSSPVVNINYRKFAQSLDEVAAVLLVMMGEALANVGFSGGRYLLQAPYSELQVRRDAAISTLRNLIGSTYETQDHNQWPRGLDAYRRLFAYLEEQGQGDLRVLLVENELSRIMDALIQRAGQGSVQGLRHLGATAQIDLERMRRLVIVGRLLPNGPASPPLFAFLEALQLFVDAFESSGGSRLLRIARPPVLFYGLYGMSGLSEAEGRLVNLVIQRGLLANELDCFSQCGCSKDYYARCQIVLDKILYDVDRAIDLYAVGKDDIGTPEVRAAAYSYIIGSADEIECHSGAPKQIKDISDIKVIFNAINNSLCPNLTFKKDDQVYQAIQFLVEGGTKVWNELKQSSVCKDNPIEPKLCNDFKGKLDDLEKASNSVSLNLMIEVFNRIELGIILLKEYSDYPIPSPSVKPPSFLAGFSGILNQELCIQKDLEARWKNLVQTMAPNCLAYQDVFGYTQNVIKEAIGELTGENTDKLEPCVFDMVLPPQFEAGLVDIAAGVNDDVRGGKSYPDR